MHWNPDLGIINPRDLAWADAVVHLGGKSIATRFTKSAKQEIRSSRIDSTRLLVETMLSLPEAKRPEVFVCASAVGYYGSDSDEPVDESAPAGQGFLAEVCQEWESEAARVEEAGVRWVSIRTGVVLSTLGGLLESRPRCISPVRAENWAAANRPWRGSRSMMWPEPTSTLFVYDYVRGPVNAVRTGPRHSGGVRGGTRRSSPPPGPVPTPGFVTELVLGRDGAKELALADQKVVPERLQETGYQFAQPTLADCLEEELGTGA